MYESVSPATSMQYKTKLKPVRNIKHNQIRLSDVHYNTIQNSWNNCVSKSFKNLTFKVDIQGSKLNMGGVKSKVARTKRRL